MDVKQEHGHSWVLSLWDHELRQASLRFLKVAYNYEEQGEGVVIMTALDTVTVLRCVESDWYERPPFAIEETTDILAIRDPPEKPYCVLVDSPVS